MQTTLLYAIYMLLYAKDTSTFFADKHALTLSWKGSY